VSGSIGTSLLAGANYGGEDVTERRHADARQARRLWSDPGSKAMLDELVARLEAAIAGAE